MAQQRIIIVGAGLAGLAAAWRLRGLGAEVVVLERGDRPGGRATSDTREGFVFDAGAQLVCSRDRSLLGLIEDAQLGERLLPLRPVAPALLHAGRVVALDTTRLRGIARVPGLRGLDALRMLRLERLRRRFAAILDPAAPELGVRLDDRSVADFSRLYFGPRVLEHLTGPLVESAVLADPEQASRLLLLLWMEQRGLVGEASLRGGLALLAETLAERVDTRLGTAVESIDAGSDAGLDVFLEPGEGTRELGAEAVLVATPAAAAARVAQPLLTRAEVDYFATVRSTTTVVLHVALETPSVPVSLRVRIPAREGGPAASVALEPAGAAGRAPEGRGVASIVARDPWSRAHVDAPDETLEKELLRALEPVAPGSTGRVLFTHLRRYREAGPRCDVGRFRAMERFGRVQRDRRAAGRRLYFAGDHLGLPTLEGAVSSGLRAAEAIASDLGLIRRGGRS